MKKIWWLACVLAWLGCLSAFAQSNSPQYEAGKILSVKKLSSPTSSGADAALRSNVDKYDVSIQVGDTVYVCRYSVMEGADMSWLQGKEAQVRIKGKTMYVKRLTGGEAKASIVHTNKVATTG